MTVVEEIDEQLKKALKAGDKKRVTVLRGLKSDLNYKRIDLGSDLTDEHVIEVLNSAAKKRREAIDQYERAGRDDLVKQESFELEVIISYLPAQLNEGELRKIVKAAIEESHADSPGNIGQVMKVLMPKVKGRADGKLVNRLVTELLAK